MIAAQVGLVHSLRLNLQCGISVNVRDKRGRTALMWADAYQKVENVKLLRRKRADVSERTPDAWAAFRFAQEKGRFDLVKSLRRHRTPEWVVPQRLRLGL